jgi:hypothetical protein
VITRDGSGSEDTQTIVWHGPGQGAGENLSGKRRADSRCLRADRIAVGWWISARTLGQPGERLAA